MRTMKTWSPRSPVFEIHRASSAGLLAAPAPSGIRHRPAARLTQRVQSSHNGKVLKDSHPADAYLAAIVSSSDDAIIAHDLDGVITLWNAAAEDLLGFTSDEAVGQSMVMLFPSEQRDQESAMLERVWRGEPISHFGAALLAKDGRIVDVSLTVSPILDPAGRVIGASTIARHIGIQRIADLAQMRLAAIVQSSEDAIVSKDLNGIVMSWNAAAERVFGFTAAEMVGQSITRIIPPERLDEERFVLAEVRAGRRIEHFETVRRDKWGHPIDISLTVSPILDSGGRVIGASKIARDISRQKRLQKSQREARAREEATRRQMLQIENRRFQESSRLKNEFVANMSHELRTPLNSIIGFTELMVDERHGPMPPRYAEFSSLILKSAQHLLQLINDILDLAKVESGKIDLTPELVDLPQVVEDVTSVVAGLARQRHIRIDANVDPQIGKVRLDPNRLKQVLYNYLSNAIKFSHDHGSVEVRIRPEGDKRLTVEVQDWGIGIKPEDVDRLFIEFQQLDASTSKRHEGTGLGLALTKRIVEAQGGSVGVRTEAGSGSTFLATLPRVVTLRTADVGVRG
jgi:PAS domain S-box-containing protein